MKRLTAHLANVKKIQLETDRFIYVHKGKTYNHSIEAPKEAKKIKEKKTIIKNTVTVLTKILKKKNSQENLLETNETKKDSESITSAAS